MMQFSEIAVHPILSVPFRQIGYVVHRQGSADCFLVDPGLEPENYLTFLESEHLTPVAVFITHGHADHIAGIPAICEKWHNTKVYVGEHEQEKLTDPRQNLSAKFGIDLVVPAADVLLKDGETLEAAGIPLEVRHVPGHSKGHVVYYIAAEPKGMLFAGDVIFRGSIGKNDLPDSDPKIQIPTIRSKILSLPDETLIYPGHGGPTTVGTEKTSNPFL